MTAKQQTLRSPDALDLQGSKGKWHELTTGHRWVRIQSNLTDDLKPCGHQTPRVILTEGRNGLFWSPSCGLARSRISASFWRLRLAP